jgi:hypothetical protein
MIGKRYLGSMITISALAVVATVAVNAHGTPEPASQGRTTAVTSVRAGIPACTYESGHTQRVCYWDARTQGNGKGWSFISHGYGQYVTYMINAPQSCQALANVGSWKSKGSDGMITWNGRELAGEMISDYRTFNQTRKSLDRACTAWIMEYTKDHWKSLK